MNRMRKLLHGLASVGAVCLCTAVLHAMPPNDECAGTGGNGPSPISGEGAWSLDDMFSATQQPPTAVPTPVAGCTGDAWYCWTATWTSTGTTPGATISYGGGTGNQGNTVAIEVWDGCACPTGPATLVNQVSAATPTPPYTALTGSFHVVCGRSYLIRVSAENYGGLNGDTWRTIRIAKNAAVATTDCDFAGPVCVPECCGAKPEYSDPVYQTNFTGRVAVMTANQGLGGVSYPSLTIFNLDHPTAPSPPSDWDPVPGPAPSAFRYSKASWAQSNLGSIFGITLDDTGNIYAAHAGIYGSSFNGTCGIADQIGALGGSTSVFRIDGTSGNPAVFADLPGGSVSAADPGLGNITFDCGHQMFFVSHFGDGRVYRLNASGSILNAFDHARNAIDTLPTGTELDPTRSAADYRAFVPLGERVWAVQVHNNRLYYSVWGQSKNYFLRTPGTTTTGTVPNSIWSVAITATGDFVPNSRRQEILPASHPGNYVINIGQAYNAPVADISFSSGCRMLLAERDMQSLNDCSLAHSARALEYVESSSGWVPSNNFRGALGYEVGLLTTPSSGVTGNNCSGGCDYDHSPSSAVNGSRLWVTADAARLLTCCTTYGLNGILTNSPLGSTNQTTIAIDYDSFLTSADKTEQGDVEIPCVRSCGTIDDLRVICTNPDGPGSPNNQYTYTFKFNNNSGFPVRFITFTPVGSVNPVSIDLVAIGQPIVPSGGMSLPITVTVTDPTPADDEFCIRMTLADPTFTPCCVIDHCVETPDCDCLQLPVCESRPGPVPSTVLNTITVQNLGLVPFNQLFLFVDPPIPGVTITPAAFTFANVAPGASTAPLNFIVSPIPLNTPFTIRFAVHLNGEFCCSEVKRFPGVPRIMGGPCDHIDFNNDGVFPDTGDLDDFLSVFAGGPCSNDPDCNDIDFNNDGIFPDSFDIDKFLAVFAGDPC